MTVTELLAHISPASVGVPSTVFFFNVLLPPHAAVSQMTVWTLYLRPPLVTVVLVVPALRVASVKVTLRSLSMRCWEMASAAARSAAPELLRVEYIKSEAAPNPTTIITTSATTVSIIVNTPSLSISQDVLIVFIGYPFNSFITTYFVTVTITSTEVQPALKVTLNVPRVLFRDLTVKVVEPLAAMDCDVGVILRLLGAETVTVAASMTEAVRETVVPPFCLTDIAPGLIVSLHEDMAPVPVIPPTGPVSTAEQSVTLVVVGAVVPNTVASEETSTVWLTLL